MISWFFDMNELPQKFQQQKKQQTTQTQLNQLNTHGYEFSSVEEMLRFDAAQTQVPPSVEMRLADSVQKHLGTPTKARPWWKKLFRL